MANEDFNGIIKLDVRDSTEDWTPYLVRTAPTGAPNILFVLYDDTGLGAWSPFGGEINMPCLQKIADNGLRYTQWHTAALCSPTRGMLLTGRNHHLNGNASITEGANGFPGQHARMPDECATVAQLLQDAGWSTFWVGKNHNVPETDVALGSTKKQWPLAKGFDRFYGFIGGETNQFYPDLISDNHPVEQPYLPKDGYHLSKDLADQAIQMIKDQKASNPSKPWYMWFCPGANHAPHQILDPRGTIAEYGYDQAFTDGYDAYRERVWKRMIDDGILPEGTQLTDLNPLDGIQNEVGDPIANATDLVRPWNSLNDQEKELFTKLMQVYAAFSTYTDAQVQRIYDYLEATGQLENTLIIYAADNGASGEGSPSGSVNENKFFNGYPDDIATTMETVTDIGGLDALGGEDTYEHYPTGWAAATSTPFKMFKRYAQYSGGTCDPLVMSWPARIKDIGGIRHQYHHATDIVPTILEACGLPTKMPDEYKGVRQYPLSGVSMVYTFAADAADLTKVPTEKKRQYYAMLGTRGIWEDGWKACAVHAPLSGTSHFDTDEWELYHVDEDRSESRNLAKSPLPVHQQKLADLKAAWDEEADKNWVLPLDDRSAIEQAGVVRPTEEAERDEYIYYPGTAAVPESVAVNLRGLSYKISAEVTIEAGCQGVIFAHGSRFGGHALFIKEMKLYYVYNFLGIPERQYEFVCPDALEPQKDPYTFLVEFERTGTGEYLESVGHTKLSVIAANGKAVTFTEGEMSAQIGKFTLCGDGLCIGYDSADAVTKEYITSGVVAAKDTSADAVATQYAATNPFKNGTIKQVVITPIKPLIQPAGVAERFFAGAFARD